MNAITTMDSWDGSVLRLDPSCIRPWHGNARDYGSLNEENCSELIQSIAELGGNRQPVFIRPVPGEKLRFELLAGSRRHFAVSHLRRNHPDIFLLAQVVSANDEEAFRIADVENRVRSDVSPVERGRNFVWALDRFYDGRQRTLAERLGKSEAWLSKYLKIAAIPDDVLQAFASPADLSMTAAYGLAAALEDAERSPQIIARARDIALEQVARKGADPMPASEVLKSLLEIEANRQAGPIAAWQSEAGLTALTLEKQDRKGLSIMVHKGSAATVDELTAAFREALAQSGWE